MPILVLIVISTIAIAVSTYFNELKYNSLDTAQLFYEAKLIEQGNIGNFGDIPVTEETPTIFELTKSVEYSEYGISITFRDGIILDSEGLIIPLTEYDVTSYWADVEVELSNGVYRWISSN